MAQKRMFDKGIIETDAFMDMPMPTKALYFLLGMEADDEGFVSPARVMRIYGGNPDDLKVLIAKEFVIQFESGVVVITDWKTNNWLDERRMKETIYQVEKRLLCLSKRKYVRLSDGLATARLEERSIEENRGEEINDFSNEKCPPKPEEELDYQEVEYKIPTKSPAREFLNKRREESGRPPMKPLPPTTKQEISVAVLKAMTYFREQIQQEHRELHILDKPDESRNKALLKLARLAYEYFSYDEKVLRDLIDWWIAGAGEWATYRPESCFSTRVCEDFKNKDVPKKGKERKIIEL